VATPFGIDDDPAGCEIVTEIKETAASPQPPRRKGVRQPNNVVVVALIVRIVREPDGGWLVITHRGHAWLHGSRQAAIEEKHWLDAQWWGQR